ncbi:MAG: hypothetical protein ACKO38_03725, partial [Planctomycetota bacterium]
MKPASSRRRFKSEIRISKSETNSMPLPNVSRRALLASAGLAMLNDVASGQDNPAEAVADRTTTIKINRVTPLPGGSKVYVKIETNHGVTGYGEITGLEPKVAAVLVTSLFEL